MHVLYTKVSDVHISFKLQFTYVIDFISLFFSFSKQKKVKSLVQMKSQVMKTESADIFLINWVCI